MQVLPFQVADVSSASSMARFGGGTFDIIVSKHALIHAPEKGIAAFLASWNTLGATYLLVDNWPATTGPGKRYVTAPDIQWGDYREPDLHAPPFALAPPRCARRVS